jgi:hypothetical protein
MSAGHARGINEVVTIGLTPEQRASIQEATGVAVKEISVLDYTGEGARELAPGLLSGISVVMCW